MLRLRARRDLGVLGRCDIKSYLFRAKADQTPEDGETVFKPVLSAISKPFRDEPRCSEPELNDKDEKFVPNSAIFHIMLQEDLD
ncbi:hypothetical protein NPIL_651921 [Nephila pilipes]|uniref:Uncharacterized protein n=2 Tax=Nephila pilipes TaxID=299642 RepID=A0A8X6P962_NEPPI|nr:hypothetical protein NPIL_651921 [Nephila pilipes]